MFASEVSVPVELSEELDEVRCLLKDEYSIKNNKKMLLERIEEIRDSQFAKLLDDYGRIMTLISIIKKLILFLG